MPISIPMFLDTRAIQTANIQSSSSSSSSSSSALPSHEGVSFDRDVAIAGSSSAARSETQGRVGVAGAGTRGDLVSTSNSTASTDAGASAGADKGRNTSKQGQDASSTMTDSQTQTQVRGSTPFKRFKSRLVKADGKTREGVGGGREENRVAVTVVEGEKRRERKRDGERKGDKVGDRDRDRVKTRRRKEGEREGGARGDASSSSSSRNNTDVKSNTNANANADADYAREKPETNTNQTGKPSNDDDGASETSTTTAPTTTMTLKQQRDALSQRIQAILLLSGLSPSSSPSPSRGIRGESDVSGVEEGGGGGGNVSMRVAGSEAESGSGSGSGSDLRQVQAQAPSSSSPAPTRDVPASSSNSGSGSGSDTHSGPTINAPTLKLKQLNESLFKFQQQLADTKFMNFLTTISVPSSSNVHIHEQQSDKDQQNQEPEKGKGKEATCTEDPGVGKVENGGSAETQPDNIRDVLDKWTRFVIPKHFGKPKTKGEGEKGNRKEESRQEIDDGDRYGDDASSSDDSSIVLSCPLEPLNEDDVEVARSEVVSSDTGSVEADSTHQKADPRKDKDKEKDRDNSSAFSWPFCKNFPSQGTPPISTIPYATRTPRPRPRPASAPARKEIRVWYPSRIKVSVEATWWGYRIYLPPPVMQILSDKSIEAAKRAAMLTAALSWLVSHIPVEVLPPQFRGLSLLLKEIVPLVGYIGGFIAWSWNSIRGFDKGDGVILSATWLLPIVLIPGTWIYTEEPIQSRDCDCDHGSDIPLTDAEVRRGTGTGTGDGSAPSQKQQPSHPTPTPPPLPPKNATFAGATPSGRETVVKSDKSRRPTIRNNSANRQK